MVGKRKKKKEKPVYVKITFVIRKKDIPKKKDWWGHTTSEEGLKEFLHSLGIKSYEYEFGQIVTKPAIKEFEGNKGIRGKSFGSVWLPKPVKLKGLKKKTKRKRYGV